jgi:copper(I)-binding protein
MRSSRRSSRSLATPAVLASLAVSVLVLGGCSSPAASAGSIAVRDAWVRLPTGAQTAGYLVIENGTGQADVLTSVTIPGGGSVMLHQTTTDASGMTGMHPVDGIHVPAGGTVELAPGGFHMMIDGLGTVAAGDKVELDLMFEHAGKVVVQAEVRAG